MCWVNIVVAVVMAIVGELLRPKAKSASTKPAGLGDFQFPTSEAGRVFPWIAGTVKLLGPNNTARNDLKIAESYKRVKSGWFSTSKQSFGYRYYIGLQMIFCSGPIDKVVGFQVNDTFLKMRYITPQTDYIDCYVDDLAFYGDAKQDGGFGGLVRVYRGTSTQPVDTYLQNTLLQEPQSSAYPNVCHGIFYGFCVAMSPTPPPILPIISRWPNGLGVTAGQHVINTTASNAICAVYDLMTDTLNGLAIDPSKIDRPAFLAAALICFNEGIGVNVNMDSAQSGDDAIKSIMQYADGVVFEDPFTSLWTVKLARGGYDITTLVELNENNSRCTGREKTDWADTKNTITIAYLDKDKNYTNQSITVEDQGNLAALNMQVNATSLDMTAIDNFALAMRIGERSRQALSTPFTKLTIEAQGIGDTLKINDVFVAKYPTTRRIAQMVLRVTDIEYANSDDVVTKIEAIEDKFGVKFVSFTTPPGSGWQPPVLSPLPLKYQTAMELPYAMTPGLVQDRYVLTSGVRAGAIESSFNVYRSTVQTSTGNDLAAGGLLGTVLSKTGAYSGTGLQMTVTGVVDPERIDSVTTDEFALGLSLILVDDELIAFQTVVVNADGSVTLTNITRSVYDTVPADHAVGATVFFLSSGPGLAQATPYPTDVNLSLKYTTVANGNELPIANAVPIALTLAARAQRPYPPGNWIIGTTNALALTAASTPIVGNITMNWAYRDRIASGLNIIPYNAADIGPEPGTTYIINIYDDTSGTLLATYPVSIDSATVTAEVYTVSLIRVELSSLRSGLASRYKLVSRFMYSKSDTTKYLKTGTGSNNLTTPTGNYLRTP